MKVLFRVDASLEIGSGHVMRCLTLAEEFQKRGAEVQFVCREHDGNLCGLIDEKGFPVRRLAIQTGWEDNEEHTLAHASWLGSGWRQDAEQTLEFIGALEARPDWLIIDHYAIDHRWEAILRPYVKRIMAIDDLADREHDCDLLLDQNLGREKGDYVDLVPVNCNILTGPKYALLRPEFAALREYSLSRRTVSRVDHLLISMGGVDRDNATAQVLEALKQCNLPQGCHISVVMGPHAPWLEQVCELATEMPWQTEALQNVRDMAQLMAESDLAIGAAGVTAWERCALGLPSLLVVLGENQRGGANALEQCGAVLSLGGLSSFYKKLPSRLDTLLSEGNLNLMQHACSVLVDGEGTERVEIALMGQ